MIKNKKQAKGKRMHPATLKQRKVLNAKKEQGECQQKACMFFINGGCKACKECGSESKTIDMNCKTCFDCENKPNSLRWDDKELKEKNNNQENKYDKVAEEMAIKQELLTLLSRLENLQNKKGENELEQKERKVRVPSYTG